MSDQGRHTPGPWEVATEPHGVFVMGDKYGSGNTYCIAQVDDENNARRIVACVNACEGVPTDALEAGLVREMIQTLEALVDGSYRMLTSSARKEKVGKENAAAWADATAR